MQVRSIQHLPFPSENWNSWNNKNETGNRVKLISIQESVPYVVAVSVRNPVQAKALP